MGEIESIKAGTAQSKKEGKKDKAYIPHQHSGRDVRKEKKKNQPHIPINDSSLRPNRSSNQGSISPHTHPHHQAVVLLKPHHKIIAVPFLLRHTQQSPHMPMMDVSQLVLKDHAVFVPAESVSDGSMLGSLHDLRE